MKKTILVAAACAAALMTRESPPAGDQQRAGTPPPSRGERFASFTGGSYSPETRTCEAVFATGEVVSRSWYTEQLRIDADAIDLRRVPLNQVRLLFNHDTRQVIGTVQLAEIRSGQLVGVLRFAQTEAGDLYAGMVERGELTGISVGYLVHQWTRVSDDQADKDEWIATRWELMEVSLVPVPADPFAGVRSAEVSPGNPPNVADPGAGQQSHEEEDMQTRNAPGAAPGGMAAIVAGALNAGQAVALRAQAITLGVSEADADAILGRDGLTHAAALEAIMTAASQARSAPVTGVSDAVTTQPAAAGGLTASQALQLRGQGVGFGLPEADVDAILGRDGLTRAQAADAILEAAAARQTAATAPIPAGGAMRTGIEASEHQRNGMIDAISSRMSGSEPSEQGRQYRGWRMLDIFAARAGITSRDPVEIYNQLATRAMNTSSDFPLLLEAAANKNLLAAYMAMSPTYRAWALKKSFQDFKPHKFLRVGDFPALVALGEGSEIKAGTWKESREEASLTTKGRLVTISRQMMINDDLGAFGDFAAGAARAAARVENAMAYALLLQGAGLGPAMADTKRMFHADHANLGTPGAINSTTLSEARAKGRKQTDLDGTVLNIELPLILCGPDKETEAEKAITSIQAVVTGEVNVFGGRRRVVTDGAITGNQWWNLADPASGEANFIFGYLRDQASPQVRQDKPFNFDGMSFGVVHDFAVGAIDHRFGVKNAGD